MIICYIGQGLLLINILYVTTKNTVTARTKIIVIIIIINAKIKVTLNTNVAGALYKNYQTK